MTQLVNSRTTHKTAQSLQMFIWKTNQLDWKCPYFSSNAAFPDTAYLTSLFSNANATVAYEKNLLSAKINLASA